MWSYDNENSVVGRTAVVEVYEIALCPLTRNVKITSKVSSSKQFSTV